MEFVGFGGAWSRTASSRRFSSPVRHRKLLKKHLMDLPCRLSGWRVAAAGIVVREVKQQRETSSATFFDCSHQNRAMAQKNEVLRSAALSAGKIGNAVIVEVSF